MDLASFELVSNCWPLLKELLEARLLDIVLCNEEEANMVAQASPSQVSSAVFCSVLFACDAWPDWLTNRSDRPMCDAEERPYPATFVSAPNMNQVQSKEKIR